MSDQLTRMLGERPWLLADGAMGTNLYNMGLTHGQAPDLWTETQPDKVRELHLRMIAAGADIKEMAELSYPQIYIDDLFSDSDRVANRRKPIIAAVNGFALGGGCELMMMCDFAIAGEGAKFGQPEVKLGVIAGMGGTQRMTKLIGRALAMDMHLTGRMMDAAEALRAGLVARVVPDDQVVAQAMAAAHTIAGYSRPATRLAREAVMRAEELSLAEGVAWERGMFQRLFGTPDQREGMQAFVEKRKPRFHPD